MPRRAVALLALALLGAAPERDPGLDALVRAYPDQLAGYDATSLVWRDGTRMALDAEAAGSQDAAARDGGSIREQVAQRYRHAPGDAVDGPEDDPGRARNRAFFTKMYGDCRGGEVARNLVPIVWLPSSWGRTISVTSVNGVARALQAVSDELDALPAEERRFLLPLGGTYNCRGVAGGAQPSMHSWGAAIDINVARTEYWRWSRGGPSRPPVPADIVAAFERHGFIWGGRWAHFDTMHFEYRPELLLPGAVAGK